jgi:DNA polymerase elongation subunit (family B)
MKLKGTKPKIVLLDIENSHNIVASFQLFNQNPLPHTNILQERFIICAAWKFLGESKIHSISPLSQSNPKRADIRDDSYVTSRLREVISAADIVIAHNGDRHDLPIIRGRMVYHQMPPLPPVRTIDTLKIARRYFNLNSRRLDYLGAYFGLGRKLHVGNELWLDILQGKKSAVKEMAKYNMRDVELLEQVYERLAPYHEARPNAGAIIGTPDTCPNPTCQAVGYLQKRGYSYTKTGQKQRYQCTACGSWACGPTHKIPGIDIR